MQIQLIGCAKLLGLATPTLVCLFDAGRILPDTAGLLKPAVALLLFKTRAQRVGVRARVHNRVIKALALDAHGSRRLDRHHARPGRCDTKLREAPHRLTIWRDRYLELAGAKERDLAHRDREILRHLRGVVVDNGQAQRDRLRKVNVPGSPDRITEPRFQPASVACATGDACRSTTSDGFSLAHAASRSSGSQRNI